MDDDKIREAAEKLEAQCAAVACDGSAHALSWAVIDTVLRTLVADTARRCAEIADAQWFTEAAQGDMRDAITEAIRKEFKLNAD